MRYVILNEAKPGDVLSMEIYDSYGRVLLDKGISLTRDYIAALKRNGLMGVYITDELSDDIQVETLISAKLRGQGLTCVKEQNIAGCAIIAEEMVKTLLQKDSICLELSAMKANDDYTYYHSVNVALFACAIGTGLKLPQYALIDLATIGMLHDFGKTEIPPAILNKASRLTPEEFEIMKSHTQLGYDKIKNSTVLTSDIKDAVLSHHENVDGSGYPNGTTGKDQSLYTKIIHVADVYDALTSNRPYKKPYSTSEAIEYLMGASNIQFDQKVVETLAHHVALYPRGHKMRLSDGRYCIIVDNQGVNTMRPVVRTMDGSNIDLHDSRFLHLTLEDIEADHMSEEFEAQRKHMIGASKKATLMLVDDMKTNLINMQEMLKYDYECILLKSGYQALEYIKKNKKRKRPDLIIMDIDMPEITGIEAIKFINQELCDENIPVLFVTALGSKETVLACKEVGASGYILRPYQPIYFKSEISRILTGIDITQ